MGRLIATTQATVDGVVDPVGEWVQADGDHGDHSFERQGNVHVLGDRGTVRMQLSDVKRFASGVVLLTYLPQP